MISKRFPSARAGFMMAIVLLIGIASVVSSNLQAQEFNLRYAPAPVDNPLKGLVPYAGAAGRFPGSMEFWYFPIRDLMHSENEFDWSSLEEKLGAARQRGCQMVFRTFLEYPGQPSAMPEFLVTSGVRIIKYQHDGKSNATPDYSDERLIAAMESFVAALGEEYDGDPRIGFISMGVLGQWGEWHTWPREELFASVENQRRVMDAFEKAFTKTRIVMRYPAGEHSETHAANHDRPFGYHDDSFAWATIETGKEDDDWFYMAALREAGALDKWKTHPIGGEIRPEVRGCVFDEPPCAPQGQEFDQCVARTHASWLLDSGFPADVENPEDEQRIERATVEVRKMGYEFFVRRVRLFESDGKTTVELVIENRGVAPFYYDWPITIEVVDATGAVVESKAASWKLTDTLPGEDIVWKEELASSLTTVAAEALKIRIPNPMPGGRPLKFANEELDGDGSLVVRLR